MRTSFKIAVAILLTLFLTLSGISHQALIAQKQLPDLVVSQGWENNGQICYTLKNIGDAAIGGIGYQVSYYNYLFIDGNKVAIDHITITLEPGQQVNRCFSYQFQMTLPQHTITICADWQQDITESNEQNNCWEQTWEMQEDLPDLIVDKIECGAGNKVSVTVKNNGTGPLPAQWNALGEIYFNGQSKGIFSLTSPTSTFNGGIAVAGGSSTYLLSWDILAPTLVMCAVDIMNDINESNEQNNIKEENVSPPFATCSEDCACLTLDEAKEQGYSLYCDGVQTLCGYDADGTPKHCWTRVLPPPDLIIRGVRLNSLGDGEYEVEYTVANWGRGDAPASVSALFVDDTLVAEETIAELISAEERDEVFSWHFNTSACTPPTDVIRVVVDYPDDFEESYEDNNEDSITWECAESPPPDLHIRRVWTVPLGAGQHQIGYEVENIGTGAAPASNTGLYVDGTLVEEDPIGPLAPLEHVERVFIFTYDLSSCTGSWDTIKIYADVGRTIVEPNEGNNWELITWDCPEEAEPDLVIHNIWWEAEPTSLQNLTIHYTVENRSVADAGPSTTKIWINDELFTSDSLTAMSAGEMRAMVTVSERWTPWDSENHIYAYVDANREIDEGTEGERNNILETDWAFELNCYNRFQDRDETDIDCGGSDCAICERCDLTTLPGSWDWRDYYTLPDIRDQGNCGSCWAHAAAGAMEGTYAINFGTLINLSEQFIICQVSGDCDGGCPHDVLGYAHSTGIVDETCQAYLARNSPCTRCSDWRERLWTIANYGRVSSNVEDVKRALICYGPLSVCSENWKHCFVIVGYDDTMAYPEYRDGRLVRTYSAGSWIMRNSWGLDYGDDLNGDGFYDDPGYAWIPYSGHSHSDLIDYVHYVIGVQAP